MTILQEVDSCMKTAFMMTYIGIVTDTLAYYLRSAHYPDGNTARSPENDGFQMSHLSPFSSLIDGEVAVDKMCGNDAPHIRYMQRKLRFVFLETSSGGGGQPRP